MSRRAWGRVIQVAAFAIVLYFLYEYVAFHWDELRHSSGALEVHAGYLAAAAAIILGTYAMLIAAWDAVLRGWDQRLPYPDAARIWCLSNLARYVPGRVWQIAGMAALAQQAGVSPWAAVGSSIVIQFVNIGTGVLVTAIFAPGFGHPVLIVAAGLVTVAGAAMLAWPAGASLASRALSRVSGRSIELRAVRPGALLLSAGVTAVQWIAYGLALSLCVRGLTGQAINLTAAIGVFTGSYTAGLINVFTPAGIGTREYILVDWLTGQLHGPAAAILVTAGSRILMTATELLAALVVLPLTRQRADGHED
ncbi:MAG: lysylphosphatidylglycerol synthase domain-containing protein [Gemmatimonadales bacterium]